MPVIYFAVASLGVLAATFVAAFIKTAETRKQMRNQLTLEIEAAKEPQETPHDKEPAALVSVG